VFFMLYGHTIDALLARLSRRRVVRRLAVPARADVEPVPHPLGLRLQHRDRAHWSSHIQVTPAWWRRVRRFAWFVFLGYSLHSPVGRAVDYKYATEAAWRTFWAVDVAAAHRRHLHRRAVPGARHAHRARFHDQAAVPSRSAGRDSPAAGGRSTGAAGCRCGRGATSRRSSDRRFRSFPAVPWSAFILVGAALGQIYSSWGGRTSRSLPTGCCCCRHRGGGGGYGAAYLPIAAFANGARSVLPVDLLIRTGACMAIHGRHRATPASASCGCRASSAPWRQETLVIYFFHLCVIYGSAWSYGLCSSTGTTFSPVRPATTVAVLVVAMSAMAWWWNWAEALRPRRGATYAPALAGLRVHFDGRRHSVLEFVSEIVKRRVAPGISGGHAV
jgi:hypothetical protein